MKKMILLALLAAVAMTAGFAASSLPSVSVSGVTATSPVLRSTGEIAVSATVTPTFDTGSGPTPVAVNNSCRSSNNYCGTGNSAVTDQTVVTTTTVTVGTGTTASAADFNSSSAPAATGTSYSGTLATPSAGADGTITVTVTAHVSEVVTTTVTTDTANNTCTSSKGVTTCTPVGTPTTVTASNIVTKTGAGSNTGSYILDINPPILTLKPDQAQPSVPAGGIKNIHNVTISGSADTPYTLTDTATGPGGSYSADGTGTFGHGKDGIAPNAHDLVAIHIACDAPTGAYTASAVANTKDLGLNPFPPINSQTYAPNQGNDSGGATDTFTVVSSGTNSLLDQTTVVSELPNGSGGVDYASMSCFTSTATKNKVNTFPGSLHITATVNTTIPCGGGSVSGNISGAKVTLTLPFGFKFDTTGASPPAHVFIGPAASGFDFHYPTTLAEVTGLLPKGAISGASSLILTVDLSALDLGLGKGLIPASDTIYVRAHAVFNGTSAPTDGTQYQFTTSVTADGLAASSNTKAVNASSTCVNGN